jgi:hypothetical protein
MQMARLKEKQKRRLDTQEQETSVVKETTGRNFNDVEEARAKRTRRKLLL